VELKLVVDGVLIGLNGDCLGMLAAQYIIGDKTCPVAFRSLMVHVIETD